MSSLLAWIILGLAVGFIASRTVRRTSAAAVIDIVIGTAGAIVGGWLFDAFGRVGMAGFNPIRAFGRAGVAGFNLYSLCMAVVGAVLLLAAYRATLTVCVGNFRMRSHIVLATSSELIEGRVAEGTLLLMGNPAPRRSAGDGQAPHSLAQEWKANDPHVPEDTLLAGRQGRN